MRALPAVEVAGGVDVGEGLDLRERNRLGTDTSPEGTNAAVVGVEGALDLVTQAGAGNGDEGMGAVGRLGEDRRGVALTAGGEE